MIGSLKRLAFGVTAGLGALAVLLATAFRSGKTSERVKTEAHNRRRVEAANEIKDEQLDAAADRPDSRDDLVDRLRSGKF